MAGDSNIQTTARYDRRPEDAKRRAANLLQIPYAEFIEKIKLVKESARPYILSTRHWKRMIFRGPEFSDIRLYKDHWKAVNAIELQELSTITQEQQWRKPNAIALFAFEVGLENKQDDSEMEVFSVGRC